MAKVTCKLELTDLENESGNEVPSVTLTCEECGHVTESFGQRGRSVRRCLALMKEECPNDARNFYVTDKVVDED